MVAERSIDLLAGHLRGQLVRPDDGDYQRARRVFNAMIDRRPRCIARCADVADVVSCVGLARDEGMLLSVRGGGHNVAGFGTNDGGLVIDLSRMRGIRVDLERRTVRAEGGCTWGDVDHATHAFGLATPGGVVSTTGIGGLTLGGGIGHLTRKCGLSCDNLASADVVTADGRLVVASARENPDLFWALRGGGGNFGVVTSFELRLHRVSTVYAGPIFWSLDRAVDAMKLYRDFLASAPEDFNAMFAYLVVPPEEPFPRHLHGQHVCGVAVCFAGPLEKGADVVRPFRELGPPLFDGVSPMPFPALQTAFDPVNPAGLLQYWKGDFFTELSDEAIATHAAFGPGAHNIYSGSIVFPVDGAVHRIGRHETAWSYRDARFSHVLFAADSDPAIMTDRVGWVRDYWSALHRYSAGGAYVNFLMEEGAGRVEASYRDNHSRLAAIKREYDPSNLFRMNQNIEPAGVAEMRDAAPSPAAHVEPRDDA